MGRNDSKRRYRYSSSSSYKRRGKSGLSLWWICLPLIALLGWIGYYTYRLYYSPVGRNSDTVYLLVSKQSDIAELQEQIQTKVWPHYPKLMSYAMDYMEIEQHLRPGRYAVTPKMSTIELLKVLQSGTQTPVKLDLRGLRTEAELSEFMAKHLLMKQEEFVAELQDPKRLDSLGLNRESARSLFFAKEYLVHWNISPSGLIDTIVLHHRSYWTKERRAQLDSLGIDAPTASSLAAILESESSKTDEYPQIARLYLNRLHKGMLLQSDPTVKFALGDFSLKRILSVHLKVESPYNTYRSVGITPGPIRIPKTSSIDAVLQAPKHNHLYMCAKEDFSGYHNFACDYETHLRNARAYQKALDQRGIK